MPVCKGIAAVRITNLKSSLVTTDLPWDFRDAKKSGMTSILVQVETDAGITGSFIAWERLTTTRGLVETMANAVKPYLLGKDPFDREAIWQTLASWNRKGFPMVGTGAVDVCLWDIAGKAFGVPICKLMGAYRDKIRAYASTSTLARPEDYADYAMKLQNLGYTAIKIHVRGDPKWDIEACKALRAGAPDLDLMLDSSCHYGRADALRVGREIEKLNFHWFESPLPDSDVAGLAELTRVLDIPIAGAEYLYECTPNHFAPYLAGNVVDILRADARRSITMARRVAEMCAGFNVNCELHSWGSIITKAANLHIMGAITNCEFFEQPVPEEKFEIYAKDLIRIDKDGYVHVPTKPGIGIDLDWDDIDRRTIFSA